ncbi:MAG: PAS domain S-box protein [Pirellulales bacterium]
MRTLLVAADLETRHSLTELLERRGHTVTAVPRLASVRVKRNAAGEGYALVIVEVDHADADELGPQLNALPRQPGAEILALTRHLDAAHYTRLLAAGFDDLLPDPAASEAEFRLAVAERRIQSCDGCARAKQDHRRQLERSDARFHAVFRGVAMAMAMTDLDGRFVEATPAFARLLGYQREDLVGKSYSHLVGRDGLAAERQVFGELVARLRDTIQMEKLYRTRTGDSVWIRLNASLLRDAENQPEFVLLLIEDVTERKQAEAAVQKEQRLLRQLLDVHERERQFMAYEIHDGLAQHLTGALFRLQAFRGLHAQNPNAAWTTFDAALELLTETIDDARRLISGFRPPILDESGLVAAIEYLVREQETRGGPRIEFHHHVQFDRLASPLENSVFRIVQESLTNACRHSQTKRVRIDLRQVSDRLRIKVRDWGIGFDPAKVGRDRFGLQGLHERARLFAGQARITSVPSKGTRVEVELPLVEKNAG